MIPKESNILVGIDASRNRSGGAKSHILGMLRAGDPISYGIRKVHLWSFGELLNALPDVPWLVKHNPRELERSLFHQVLWQYRSLPKEATKLGCDLLFNTDAGSVCRWCPAVVMSQDMLSYEPREMRRYGLSFGRLRLLALKYIQASSMKRAVGVIFLSNYAAMSIQRVIGKLPRVCVIPHGVGAEFRRRSPGGLKNQTSSEAIRCLYVSNTLMYKHQWHVVRALGQLRKRGYNVVLSLVGGGKGKAQERLLEEIAFTDPQRQFVETVDFVRHEEVPVYLANADLFVFASSCENMPITLVEAMASGLPIACSNRGPMPEVLGDGGVLFDPQVPESIANAIESIITNRDLRDSIAKRAQHLSEQYSWERCAAGTWKFLRECVLDQTI